MKFAYYNEHDPKAAAWLRELIKGGHICPGEVDERSICDVSPDDLMGFAQCHFFAGIGGWSLALRLAGVPDDFPVWTGSCPCQPFSAAGKQLGTADDRHLWPAFYRLIEARRPALILGEQVASAAVIGRAASSAKRGPVEQPESVWIDGVFSDLESAQYACAASDLPAASVGAPHIRQRLWWMAVADGRECGRLANGEGCERDRTPAGRQQGDSEPECSCATRRLADMQQPGLEGHAGHGDDRNEPGRLGAEQAGSVAEGCGSGGLEFAERKCDRGHGGEPCDQGAASQSEARSDIRPAFGHPGAWDDFDLIPCRDGKARRVPQSCIFPVVNGVSASVDHLRIASNGHPLTEEKIKGRAALLRGAGNAIVPEVAAVFIRAALDATLNS